jgi:serine phosphatase RsbU (regulator of sigma subunit)
MAEAASPAPELSRRLWWLLFFSVVPLALVAFASHLDQADIPTLVQGPLVIDPTLGDRLATVLPGNFIRWSQLGIHIGGFAFFAGLAALIALRSQESVSLIASAMLVTVGASLFAPLAGLQGGPGRLAQLLGEMAPGHTAGMWTSISGILLVGFLLVATGERLGGAGRTALGVLGVVGVVSTISPGWPLDPARLVTPWKEIWTGGIPLVALAAAWWRSRLQPGERRRQIRPVLIALALILAAYLVLVLLRPDLRPDAFGLVLATPRLQALYGLNTLLLLTGAVFALPVSIVLAVVRYRLFEIDVLVNRALVYGALTGVVTLVFLAVTLVTAAAAGRLLGEGVTGTQVGQAAAIAGVITGTVMSVGLQPLRRRLQRSVDRSFYREKFDADQALDALSGRLIDVLDAGIVKTEVVRLVSSTLRPDWVDIYPASTIPPALAATTYARFPLVGVLPGMEVAVPLRSNDRVIGVMALGRKLSGTPYRGLDLRFLSRVAEKVGPALRMVELVERQETDRVHRERYEQELSVARRIQRELLPRVIPQPEGWRFEVFYEPAREVGGDFYDFYDLGEGSVGVVVGDVTDKGMPAALVMASCRTVLRGIVLGDRTLAPGEVLRRANELLVGDIPTGMFITCLYVQVETSSGKFRFSNAGHNLPLHKTENGTREIRARGMPLGLLSGMEYEGREAVIERGESVVLTSDGITEAHNADRVMFGFDRMRDNVAAAPSDGGLQTLLLAHQSFVGEIDQEDDITLIALNRMPIEAPPSS